MAYADIRIESPEAFLTKEASAEELYRVLNYKREPTFEAVAPNGKGVFDTLKSVAKQILVELRKR